MQDLHDKRERNKLSLETYFFEIDNKLERITDKIVEDYLQKIKDEKNREYKNDDFYLEGFQEYIYLEEELFAYVEIQIVYIFKMIETKLKFLLSAAYADKKLLKLFNWREIENFLLNKNIELKKINHYQEINQIRLLNNSIKHSENYLETTDVKRIPEFTKINRITYVELLSFYNRIKKIPSKFISSLSNHIYDDLYTYDNNRIENMANEIVLTMNKDDAEKLINNIKSKY